MQYWKHTFLHTKKAVSVCRHGSTMIDKFSLLFYNESKLGGVEMHPGFDKYMMQLRMESKEQEN